jgi:ABC-2 type transport system permease protein
LVDARKEDALMDGIAIYGIWLRDVKRFLRVKSQLLGSLVRPILWLLIMGAGLRPIVNQVQGVDYIQFIFGGVVSMTLLFAAMQSAISIVWDREFGYLKEILVAPIPRLSVVVGKALSGSTTATMQGILSLIFIPVIGIHFALWKLPLLVLCMLLISFSIASLGIAIAGKMSSFEGFGTISNFLLMPMYFLSGAVYPVSTVPVWLKPLIYVNPLTYGVDLMRNLLVGIHQFAAWVDIGILLLFSLLMISFAIPLFKRE